MPPKPKKNTKGESKFIGEVEITTMTRDELEDFVKKLKESLKDARDNRNLAQMKRDKIRKFWNIKLQENELEAKMREIFVTQEEADTEMKHLRQELKYWEFELPGILLQLKAEEATHVQQAQDDFSVAKVELLKEKYELRQKIRAAEIFRQQEKAALDKRYAEEYEQMSCDTREEDKVELDAKYEKELQELKSKFDLKERVQIFSYNEERNAYMIGSRKLHHEAYDDLKDFYMDITLNNLALIHGLQEYLNQSQRDARSLDARLPLLEPFKSLKSEVATLRFRIVRYKDILEQIACYKQRNMLHNQRINGLLWESAVLLERNEELHFEVETLESTADEIIQNLQQITGLKTVQLEEKVAQLEKINRALVAQIAQTMTACAPLLRERLECVEEIVDSAVNKQTHKINELRYKLARARKAYDDLSEYYECKCKELGVPKDQLGFELLNNTTSNMAPADLLSQQI